MIAVPGVVEVNEAVAWPLLSVRLAGCVTLESVVARPEDNCSATLTLTFFPVTGFPFPSTSVTVALAGVWPSAGSELGEAATCERLALTPGSPTPLPYQ